MNKSNTHFGPKFSRSGKIRLEIIKSRRKQHSDMSLVYPEELGRKFLRSYQPIYTSLLSNLQENPLEVYDEDEFTIKVSLSNKEALAAIFKEMQIGAYYINIHKITDDHLYFRPSFTHWRSNTHYEIVHECEAKVSEIVNNVLEKLKNMGINKDDYALMLFK